MTDMRITCNRLISLLLLICSVAGAGAQTINPVENDDEKPRQPTLHFYDKHGEPLEEPVLFLADLDTVTKAKSGPVYPLLNSVSIGVNFFDAVMKLAGQNHQSYDIWADISLHNWFFPVIEAGIGFADSRPDDANFHYKGKASFYAKLGMNYNFLYKSNPDYQVFLGFRAAYAGFKYDVTDITVDVPYWDQTARFDILDQKGHAFYGEVLGGIKVKLYKALSMGWTVRYHFKWNVKQPSNSNVWFIPGYGTTGGLNATFSLVYTIPLSKKEVKEEPELPDVLPERTVGPGADTPSQQSTAASDEKTAADVEPATHEEPAVRPDTGQPANDLPTGD